jgi:transmembrane sensor
MQPDLKELLRKYKEKASTPEELARLRAYFSDSNHESHFKKDLYIEIEEFTLPTEKTSEPDFKQIFNNIQSGLSEPSTDEVPAAAKKKPVFIRIVKIAAVIIPFFLLGGVISRFLSPGKPLTEPVTYTVIKAPYGARTEISMPDGSTVWLNAGSTIRYMNIFNRTNRQIDLNGEAYFKVAKNKELPFDVRTGDLSIQALGTEFNVKSYDDEDIIETTLVQGKIAIKQGARRRSIYLEPNQKAIFVKDKDNFKIRDLKSLKKDVPEVLHVQKGKIYVAEKVDPEPLVAWKDNRLILKGEELTDLVIKLERKYDVTFIFGNEKMKSFRFSGTLDNETITQVLDVLKLSAPIDYKLQGKTVLLFENKQMTEKFNNHLRKK